MTLNANDTIVAQATPTGRGGVGIIRVSGPQASAVAETIIGQCPPPREALYRPFMNTQGKTIDQGLVLYFKSPNSFTGEDVVEFQGHGGPVVMDMLINEVLKHHQVRIARPGEFSERAFLNDKLDLTQAEAIADLIEATSEQAARSAINSLQGEFSKSVNQLTESVIQLRMYVEAAIDFPEEEIDFLSDGKISGDLQQIIRSLEFIKDKAVQGSLIREGMTVVIAGKPNAGKSSLLNALAGKESAIVTDIAGTTRDVLKEHIHIDGMPLHIIDTAGLRDSPDKVEQIGISRAWEEINKADRVILVADGSQLDIQSIKEFRHQIPDSIGFTLVINKMDLADKEAVDALQFPWPIISLSAKHHQGLDDLKNHLKECMGFDGTTEGSFIARRRHIDALNTAYHHILAGEEQLNAFIAGELLAEELRIAQQHLSEVTGEFSSDDLLGRIFSSFCIGK